MPLKQVMAYLLKELEEKAHLQEKIQTSSRKIILFSKQAVMAMHRHDLGEAESKLKEAENLLHELETGQLGSSDMRGGPARTSCQEYAEAKILLATARDEDLPSPREIGVPSVSYVLGLADAIGEFRRAAVDSLTTGNIKRAEDYLQLMQEVYEELLPLQDFYTLISELRRKMDVARHLIELTFSDVSSETRRDSLERALRLLEKQIEVNRIEDRPKQDPEPGP